MVYIVPIHQSHKLCNVLEYVSMFTSYFYTFYFLLTVHPLELRCLDDVVEDELVTRCKANNPLKSVMCSFDGEALQPCEKFVCVDLKYNFPIP